MHNRKKLVEFFAGELTHDMDSPDPKGSEAYSYQDLHEVCRVRFGECFTYMEIRGAAQELVQRGIWFQVGEPGADKRIAYFITYMLKRVEDARAQARKVG